MTQIFKVMKKKLKRWVKLIFEHYFSDFFPVSKVVFFISCLDIISNKLYVIFLIHHNKKQSLQNSLSNNINENSDNNEKKIKKSGRDSKA